MRIVVQQPHYLPWLGYFDLFAKADAFIFLDTVQWIRQGRQHRTKILDANGQPHWLTVPVRGHGHRDKTLKDMQVDSTRPWAKRHWQQIAAAYGHAPRFHDQVEPLLRPFYEKVAQEKFLAEICQESLWLFWEPLGLRTELHWASDLPESSGRQERLVEICQHFHADEYYSSLGSTRYLDLSVFRAAGIRVLWQHFRQFFPGDVTRAADATALDWLAYHDWSELKRALTPSRPLESYAELPS